MFYSRAFDLIRVCWAIWDKSKCCAQAKHNQTPSLTSFLFPFFLLCKRFFIPVQKHPRSLYWCIAADSLLIWLLRLIFLPFFVPSDRVLCWKSTPQRRQNIINLFIKHPGQYGSYISGQNISFDKTSSSCSTKRRFISWAARASHAWHLEPHYSRRLPFWAIRRGGASKKHSGPPPTPSTEGEFIKENFFIVGVSRTMPALTAGLYFVDYSF